MKRAILLMTILASLLGFANEDSEKTAEKLWNAQTLWKNRDGGIDTYRIPALCTAPNGDLIAACDARTYHGGDLDHKQPINITIRRSTDGGKTWTEPKYSHHWPWTETSKWSGSDPSFIVDMKAKKVFLFYNVWDWTTLKNGSEGVYRFYVQESADNGVTWSEPRDISKDIEFEDDEWKFGGPRGKGGFIFISSGSGIQTKDGTLLHTLVHVWPGRNAIFGSPDHGKTWKAYGTSTKGGDECKIVELANGDWMINSRPDWPGPRTIHISKDHGKTWKTHKDAGLQDGRCNAQIMRYGPMIKHTLLFTNCNSNKREKLYLRASKDDGKTWNEGLLIHEPYAAYSDMAILKDGSIGILFEAAGRIDFCIIPVKDLKESMK